FDHPVEHLAIEGLVRELLIEFLGVSLGYAVVAELQIRDRKTRIHELCFFRRLVIRRCPNNIRVESLTKTPSSSRPKYRSACGNEDSCKPLCRRGAPCSSAPFETWRGRVRRLRAEGGPFSCGPPSANRSFPPSGSTGSSAWLPWWSAIRCRTLAH